MNADPCPAPLLLTQTPRYEAGADADLSEVERLMALHIGYESVEPWPLERIEAPDQKSRKAGLAPRALLKVDKDAGKIQLDSETQLTGVPAPASIQKKCGIQFQR
jgi:hypothetical protein